MVDDTDIRLHTGLARIAPSTYDVVADWADVVRRAAAAADAPAGRPAGRAAAATIAARRQPASNSVGWGTRPLRPPAPARQRQGDLVSEFNGWGTRSL